MSSTECPLHSGKPAAQTWGKQQFLLWKVRTAGLRHNQRLTQGEARCKPGLRPENDGSDTLPEYFHFLCWRYKSLGGGFFLRKKPLCIQVSTKKQKCKFNKTRPLGKCVRSHPFRKKRGMDGARKVSSTVGRKRRWGTVKS